MDFVKGTVLQEVLREPLAAEDGINQVYSVDLDQDGASDLVVVGGNYPNGQGQGTNLAQPGFVVFGDGEGGYEPLDTARFPLLQSVHARELAFADFNADGDLDIYLADHGLDGPPYPGAQNRLYLSNGDGTWRDASATLPQRSDFTHSVSTGDFDVDGDLDILVGNSGLPSFIHLLENDGEGHFTDRMDILPTGPNEFLDPAKRNTLATLMTDLDGDGVDDIVLGTGLPNTQDIPSQVLWNEGAAFSEESVTDLPLPAHFGSQAEPPLLYDVQAVDVNFDGFADLVAAYVRSVELGGYELQVLINDGNRGFTDETAQFIPDASARFSTQFAWIQFLVPADLNGDGRMDFFVDARGGDMQGGTPIALIHRPDGTYDVLREQDTGWNLDAFAQWAWWPEGGGIVDAGIREPNTVIGHTNQIAFPYDGPHWFGGTPGPDVFLGTAGRDEFAGFGGDDEIEGGAGLDAALYHANRADAQVLKGFAAWFVVAPGSGTDEVTDVERLHFDDVSVALDVDGSAGQVARILGTLFGTAAVGNRAYAGIGLDLLDDGMAYADLVALALTVLGPRSNEAFVRSVFENVVGSPPPAPELNYFTGLLDNGTFTQASLALLACNTALVAERIDLVGLAGTGLAYDAL